MSPSRTLAECHGRHGRRARAGLTLVELVVAVGLASILMVSVFRLLDASLSLWSEGEVRRATVEQATASAELLARDLRALEPGRQGDLLAEWAAFDTDGDGIREKAWPRLRLVRQASAAEMALLAARAARGQESAGADAPGPPRDGLVEVVWAVVPVAGDADARAEGLLLRGEQPFAPDGRGSFFAPGFFDPVGQPPAGVLREVSGGLLWFGLRFATQTTLLVDGWNVGPDLADASGSWDAWGDGRPDAEAFAWNEPGAGMPRVGDTPVLPRRVRVELEFERPRERQRRTRLAAELDAQASALVVANGARLPSPGSHLLVDAEWMLLESVSGDRARVRRGARASAPALHASGALVHHGVPIVVELPVDLHRDDWNLR